MRRREFLALAAGIPYASSGALIHLSLLPLFNEKYGTVSRDLLQTVSGALANVYAIDVSTCKPERFKDPGDGEAVLDSISKRQGFAMAVITAPLRVPRRNGATNIAGWADIPNDERERPRGSVITTAGLWSARDGDVPLRLATAAVHELGHNLGAWDCTDRACYMNGKIDQGLSLAPRAFCPKHREMLSAYLRS